MKIFKVWSKPIAKLDLYEWIVFMMTFPIFLVLVGLSALFIVPELLYHIWRGKKND